MVGQMRLVIMEKDRWRRHYEPVGMAPKIDQSTAKGKNKIDSLKQMTQWKCGEHYLEVLSNIYAFVPHQ